MAALVEGEAKAGGWVTLGNAWCAWSRGGALSRVPMTKVRLGLIHRTAHLPPHA